MQATKVFKHVWLDYLPHFLSFEHRLTNCVARCPKRSLKLSLHTGVII